MRLSGRAIASSFWGKAWGENLESYSDYASRLPRGRSYLRQGAVLDLQAERGVIKALVSGTRLYEIEIKIDTMGKAEWTRLKKDCAGKVGSLMDLLQGRPLRAGDGDCHAQGNRAFPEARTNPPALFLSRLGRYVQARGGGALRGSVHGSTKARNCSLSLRGVDHLELIAAATKSLHADLATPVTGKAATLDEGNLAEVFGIEMGEMESAVAPPPKSKPAKSPARPFEKSTKAAAEMRKLPARKTQTAKKSAGYAEKIGANHTAAGEKDTGVCTGTTKKSQTASHRKVNGEPASGDG